MRREDVTYMRLKFPAELYPREMLDINHVNALAEVLAAGGKLPAIKVDETYRVVDGRHRAEAHRVHRGHGAVIPCEIRHYMNDVEFLLDAIAANAKHGVPYNENDRRRIVAMATAQGVTVEALASVLQVRTSRVTSLADTKVQRFRPRTQPARPFVPGAISGAVGTYTYDAPKGLVEINELLRLVQSQRIDLSNPQLVTALRSLAGAILARLKDAA